MERDDLKIILNILYEMEGLVDMAIRREDETPAGVICLIKEKSEILHKFTSAWNVENDIEVNINEDYSIDEECELEANDNPELQLGDRNVGLNNQEPDEDIEVEFVYDESEDDFVDNSEDNSEKETVIDEEPQAEQEAANIVEEVVESSLFDASAFSDEDSAEDELNNDVDYDNEQQDEIDDESEGLDEDESVEEEEVFVGSKIVNVNRQDIRKMFTINDRYRFRRELFCNNEVDFVDNLNLVQAMSCYEDVEDYFYNDLQWDSENEDVVEFMSIIFKYFNS
ncbi:MAG: hypothetical protein E7079_04075 [Bacteroidales bacterium]|nr:hypothetical protein [Bacteroidales bacterium]